jgi:hypothetical protein
VKTAGAAGSLPRMLVTFLLGSVLSAWTLIILPRAEANGYLPAPSMNLLPTLMWVDGPFALSVYAVLILSGSTSWRGSVIGERRRSLALFCRYVLILFLGAALTGLAVRGLSTRYIRITVKDPPRYGCCISARRACCTLVSRIRCTSAEVRIDVAHPNRSRSGSS